MKRISLWLSLSLVLLVSLWGCGGQNQNPTAQFNIQPAAAIAGAEVALDGSASSDSDGKIAKYEWELADGTTLSGAKISHTFADAGSYQVTLTVTDDKNATHKVTKTVEVAAAPVVENPPDGVAVELARHIEMSKGTSIKIAAGAEPRYLMPNGTEGTWESQISGLIFDGLIESNDSFENIPAMADSWEWDLDNLSYTFHIREGIKFHDYETSGETVDCGDVVFSFKTWIHPDYPGVRFNSYENIVGAKDYHFRIFARVDVAAAEQLDEDQLPEAIQSAFSDYGIELGDAVVSKDTVDVSEDSEGNQIDGETLVWTIESPSLGKTYFVQREETQLTLHLPSGETLSWPIDGLQCLDDRTFKVTLTEIQRTFLSFAVGAGIMPQHVYEPYFEEHGYATLKGVDADLGTTVGSGPYKLDEWVTAQYVKLQRNEDFWRGRWGRQVEVKDQAAFPGIESVYWVIMPDTDAQYAALLAGEVDVLDTRSNVDQYFQLKENPNFATFVYSQLVYDYWHWNLRNELFQDVNVRKAMCSAIDRPKMVDNVLRGLGELTNGPTHPLRWDWDPSLVDIHPHYDPEKVVELMEASGWTIDKNDDGSIQDNAVWSKTAEDGSTQKMEFEIAHNTPNPRRQDFAVIMQQQLSKLGFKASIRSMETNAYYNDYLQGSNAFQTAIAGWRMGTDPDGTSLWHTKSLDPVGFNWIAYSNPEVDALLEEGLKIAEIDKARPIYQKINRLLVETMGYCWLAFPSATFAAKPDLFGAEQWSPLSPYGHLSEWYWEGKGVPVTIME